MLDVTQHNWGDHSVKIQDKLPRINGIVFEKDKYRWCVRVPSELCAYGAPLYFSAKPRGAFQSWLSALTHWGRTVVCHLSANDETCHCRGCHSTYGPAQDKFKITEKDFPESILYETDAVINAYPQYNEADVPYRSSVCENDSTPHCRCFTRSALHYAGSTWHSDFVDDGSRASLDGYMNIGEFGTPRGHERVEPSNIGAYAFETTYSLGLDSFEDIGGEGTGIFPLDPIPQDPTPTEQSNYDTRKEEASPHLCSSKHNETLKVTTRTSGQIDEIIDEPSVRTSSKENNTPNFIHRQVKDNLRCPGSRTSSASGWTKQTPTKEIQPCLGSFSSLNNRYDCSILGINDNKSRFTRLDDEEHRTPKNMTLKKGSSSPGYKQRLTMTPIKDGETLGNNFGQELQRYSVDQVKTTYISPTNSPTLELSTTPGQSSTPEIQMQIPMASNRQNINIVSGDLEEQVTSRFKHACTNQKEPFADRNDLLSFTDNNNKGKDASDEDYCVDDEIEEDSGSEKATSRKQITRPKTAMKANAVPVEVAESLKPWYRDEAGCRHTKTFTPYVFGGVEEAYRAAVEYKISLDRICSATGISDSQRLMLKRRVELGLKRKRLGRSQREPHMYYQALAGMLSREDISAQLGLSDIPESSKNIISLLMRHTGETSTPSIGKSYFLSAPGPYNVHK